MPLGISFGSNKKSIDSTTTINKNENTNQTGSESTNSTTNQATSSNTSGATSSQGSSSNTQVGNTTNTGTGVQDTQQVSTQFGTDTLAGLEGAVANLFTGLTGDQATLQSGVGKLADFDIDQFIQQGLGRAEARIDENLSSSLGSTFSQIGGNAQTNSAAALLQNSLQTRAAEELAGVEADLTAAGQGIQRDNIATQVGITGQNNSLLTGLVDALRGGVSTTTGQAVTSNVETGASNQTANTLNSQSGQSSEQQISESTQTLAQILNSILNGTTQTSGTEHTKGTEKSKGGGIAFSA